MVWGAFSAAGTGELLHWEKSINALEYRRILKKGWLPTIEKLFLLKLLFVILPFQCRRNSGCLNMNSRLRTMNRRVVNRNFSGNQMCILVFSGKCAVKLYLSGCIRLFQRSLYLFKCIIESRCIKTKCTFYIHHLFLKEKHLI